jgi:uncharacterized protein
MTCFRRITFVASLLLAMLAGAYASTARAERLEDLPQPTDYVSDYAHVLSPQTIAHLDHICAQLDHSQANAQIAIVTIQSLDGDDVDDFSNRLATKWSMGQKGSGRGLLMLFAIQDHRRRIEVGGGLQGILPDAKAGDIGRDMVPDLRANDFDGAITLGLGEVAQIIATDAKITLDAESGQMPLQHPVRHSPSIGNVILIIILVIFFGGSFIMRILLGLGLFGGWGGRGPWIGGGGFGGGGGGGGGGGDSGGSGFGGFGGGGDFDGGGAGGSW